MLLSIGAIIKVACTPRSASTPPQPSAVSSGPLLSPEQAKPASARPTGTAPAPIPQVKPTEPDLTGLSRTFDAWFEAEGPLKLIMINQPIGDQYTGEGLVTQVNGQDRIVALKANTGWVPNVPILKQQDTRHHTPQDLDQARQELAQRGYGVDLILESRSAGKTGIVGIAQSGGALAFDPWGKGVELPPPANTQVEIRWLGREWVGGYSTSQTSASWEPAIPFMVQGGEPVLKGDICLTADDCSDAGLTQELFQLAQDIGVRLTFFPNTPYLSPTPDLWAEVLTNGHELGYHTSTHSRGDWSEQWLDQDFEDFQATIREVTGYRMYAPRLVRPPFGLWDHGNWQDWVRSRGLTTAMWGRYTSEPGWRRAIPDTLNGTGSMILLAHPEPFDLNWLKENKDFLLDLSPPYHYRTLSESLLKRGTALRLLGLPVKIPSSNPT